MSHHSHHHHFQHHHQFHHHHNHHRSFSSANGGNPKGALPLLIIIPLNFIIFSIFLVLMFTESLSFAKGFSIIAIVFVTLFSLGFIISIAISKRTNGKDDSFEPSSDMDKENTDVVTASKTDNMVCSSCGFSNPSDSTYCTQCGKPLE